MKGPGILSQIRTAREHPFAATMGALIGGVVPLGTYFVAHSGITHWMDYRVGMVAGGLLFSCTTVVQWGRAAFDSWPKALGYVLLLESLLVASPYPWLGMLALAYLLGINATATACRIAHEDKPEPLPTVTAVSRERSLPRREAAKVVDRQIAARAPRPVST